MPYLMNRRKLVTALGASAVVAPFGSFAQQQGKVWRVGILSISVQAAAQVQNDAFVGAMRDLGWAEGRNIVFERFYANEDVARLQALAAGISVASACNC